VGRETLRSLVEIFTDIAERYPIAVTSAAYIVSKHVTKSIKKVISKFRGRGRKRALGEALEGGNK